MLAAHRYKMTHILLPQRNEKDLEEIPAEVMQALTFHFADSVLDALGVLFPDRSFEEKTQPVTSPGIVDALRRPDPVERSIVDAPVDLPMA